MYKMHVMRMNLKYGLLIGKTLEEVEEVEVKEDDTGWGSYLRLRILINLDNALARGRSIMVCGEKL